MKISSGFNSIAFFLLLLSGCSLVEKPKGIVVNGLLDIRTVQFNKSKTIRLDGSWEFYWDKLIEPAQFKYPDLKANTGYLQVPGAWTHFTINGTNVPPFGKATYRLQILSQEQELSIILPIIYSTYKVYLNNTLLFSSMQPGEVMDGKSFYLQQTELPVKLTGGTNQLIVQVVNEKFRSGFIESSFIIGSQKAVKKSMFIILSLAMITFGSIIIMGLYHFGLFLLRPRDKYTLYFGIFCVLYALRSSQLLVTLYPGISGELVLKMQYLAMFSAPFIFHFEASLFPDETHPRLLKWVDVIWCFYFLLYLIIPYTVFNQFVTIIFSTMVLMIIYVVVVMIKALKNRRKGSLILFTGFLIFSITTINDILFVGLVINSMYLQPYGVFFFILAQAIAISQRFLKAFEASDYLLANLQRELLQKELYANIGKLSAGITHEILNPLAGIHGPLEVLEEQIRKSSLADNKNARSSIEFMYRNVERITAIVRSLRALIYNKPEAEETVEIYPVLESILTVLDKKIKERIQFEIDIPKGLTMYTNIGALNHILINIINNAVDAIQDEGVITIRAISDVKKTELIITDTGTGIAPENIQKIFDLNYTTKAIGLGTGYGLFLVKQLADRYHITIGVQSIVQHGTTFRIQKLKRD